MLRDGRARSSPLRTVRRQGGIVMRQPSSPAWVCTTIFAMALISGAAGYATTAAAQSKFQRLFVFGDSYTDIFLAGRVDNTVAPGAILPSPPPPAPPGLWVVYPL